MSSNISSKGKPNIVKCTINELEDFTTFFGFSVGIILKLPPNLFTTSSTEFITLLSGFDRKILEAPNALAVNATWVVILLSLSGLCPMRKTS